MYSSSSSSDSLSSYSCESYKESLFFDDEFNDFSDNFEDDAETTCIMSDASSEYSRSMSDLPSEFS